MSNATSIGNGGQDLGRLLYKKTAALFTPAQPSISAKTRINSRIVQRLNERMKSRAAKKI
jgi:hypothetical protein